MADFRFIKSLVGDTPEIQSGTLAETVEAGDIGNFTSSTIEKVDDNDTATDLVLILEGGDAADTVPFIWLDPWILIEGTAKGTVGGIGSMQSIDVTSNVITVETSTLQSTGRFRLRSIEDATNKVVRLTALPNVGIS